MAITKSEEWVTVKDPNGDGTARVTRKALDTAWSHLGWTETSEAQTDEMSERDKEILQQDLEPNPDNPE